MGVYVGKPRAKTLLNEGFQLHLDYRTGFPTAIRGDSVSPELRSACAALNRERTRGLLESAQQTPPGQPLSSDVWAAAFAVRTREWEVPIVDLGDLGITHDKDGFIASDTLVPLTSGAEAQPYLDRSEKVVYKLFDLRTNGALGKKLSFHFGSDGFEIDVTDATWIDTMEKISVLNAGGGLPTELVGLASTGDYLLAKQPLAYPVVDFHTDREAAEHSMRGIIPLGGGLRQRVIVSEVEGRPWVIGDLHDRNIMRDSAGNPVVIDALLGKITPLAQRKLSWLRDACEHARSYRRTSRRPADRFAAVDDDEL